MANDRPDGKRVDQTTGTEFVGHEWDGIEELDTPMPRWWLWTFYITIAFAVGYVVAYPAIPMLHEGTRGMLGWTQPRPTGARDRRTPGGVGADTVRYRRGADREAARRSGADARGGHWRARGIQGQLRAVPRRRCGGLEGLSQPQRRRLAVGRRSQGDRVHDHPRRAPAGRPADAYQPDARVRPRRHPYRRADRPGCQSRAEPFGQGARQRPPARNCSRRTARSVTAPRAAAIATVGAPNLADAIWLYGGTREDIEAQVTNPRHGAMPAWGGRLDPVTIKMLAAYVHSLGGGEDFVEPAPAATANAKP